MIGVQVPEGLGIFLLCGTHPAYYPMIIGTPFPGVKRSGVKLTAHLYVVQRLITCGAIPPLPNTSSWRGA